MKFYRTNSRNHHQQRCASSFGAQQQISSLLNTNYGAGTMELTHQDNSNKVRNDEQAEVRVTSWDPQDRRSDVGRSAFGELSMAAQNRV